MKRDVFFWGFVFCVCSQGAFGQNLAHVRQNYPKAAVDKHTCARLIKDLNQTDHNSVALAYLGALETIWAKYTVNPLSKLRHFKKGTSKLETAVKESPNNMEIRFLRLSVQQNAPAFLGYQDHIMTDKTFLRENLHKISSQMLLQRIKSLINTN